MKTNEKKSYHHGDLKPALIQAGLEILEEQGLEALSMRAIAARVGVSHTAPKNHFDGFHGLLAAIAAEGFRQHAASMETGIDENSSKTDRMRAAAAGYVDFAQKNPALYNLMFSPKFNREAGGELMEAAGQSYGVLQKIAEGLEWPKPGPDQGPELEALRSELFLWIVVHGYASLFNEGRMRRNEQGEPVFGILDLMPDFRVSD